MRTALIFLFTGILLLVLLYYRYEVNFSSETIDIHVHDTFFVIDFLTAAAYIFVFLLFLFALGGVIGTGFRNRFFLFLLIACLIVVAYLVWTIRDLFLSLES